MAQQLLDRAQISSGVEQMSCERVSQRVSRQSGIFIDSIEKSGYRALNRANRYAFATAAEKEGQTVCAGNLISNQIIALRFIIAKCQLRMVANGDDSFLSSLASHLHLLRQQIDITAIDSAEL